MSSESRGVGGGLLQMSSDWDDRVGIKIKTQKNLSGFEQNPQKSVDQKLTPPPKKIPWGIFEPEYAGTTTNLQIVVNTQNNPYLNQAIQKIPAKFSYPKKILELKIWNHKKSLDHPHHLRSWVLPWALNKTAREICLFN